MSKHFPGVTCFFDAGGRYSHSKDAPLVFAGVGMWSSAVDRIREALLASVPSGLRKWSDSENDANIAKAIFRLMAKRQLYGSVNVIWKTGPAWERYHQTGQVIYEKGAKKAQEAIPYAKPMATLKIHLFGDIMADLYGHMLGRNRHLFPKMKVPPRNVRVTAVIDSDVHGEVNQRVFKNVMESANDLPKTEHETGIRTEFNVCLKTEQEEPLLYLADHLAGLFYSMRAYGVTSGNGRTSIIRAAEGAISKWPTTCFKVREGPFDDNYLLEDSVFDQVLPKKKRDELLQTLTENDVSS